MFRFFTCAKSCLNRLFFRGRKHSTLAWKNLFWLFKRLNICQILFEFLYNDLVQIHCNISKFLLKNLLSRSLENCDKLLASTYCSNLFASEIYCFAGRCKQINVTLNSSIGDEKLQQKNYYNQIYNLPKFQKLIVCFLVT